MQFCNIFFRYNIFMKFPKDIKQRLIEKAENDYQKFSSSLVPNCTNMLGVRLQILRKIAKEIYKQNGIDFIEAECDYFEETMITAMLIGLAAKEKRDIVLVEKFIPKINNWSVCDCFCNGLKFTDNCKSEMWKFLQKYLKSDKEFELRFAHVMLLDYFVEKEYLDKIFQTLNGFSSQHYYAQMSAAWLVSICFIQYPNETFEFLKDFKTDKFTYNKSIQKIIESFRVDKITKEKLRGLKR